MRIGTDVRWLLLALCFGCAAPVREVEAPGPVAVVEAPVVAMKPVVRPVVAAPAEVARVPALLEAAHGDGLIVSSKEGLVLLDAGLRPIKVLSEERGRQLRIADGQLYFFELKQPRLRALDLESGETRAVAGLPKLRNDCFEGGRPADPLGYVEGAGDLSVAAGVMCFDVVDQPGAGSTERVNFRVDLRTGRVEQEKIEYFTGKVCGEGKGVTKPRLCTPEPGLRGRGSPTGRWSLMTDLARGETGDQDYALVVVTERASGREHVVAGRKLRVLRLGREAMADACRITDKARVGWLGGSDVLVVEGCRDRLSVVFADGRIEYRVVDDFVVVPAVR